MKNLFKSERNSFVAAGIILFSIIVMIVTIPIALNNTSDNINSESSSIGITIAIIMHLIVLGIYLKVVWENKQNRNRDGGYIAVAIILTILGLIYMDGAIAFITDRETLFISILMFGSVFCDIAASVMMIVIYFSKPSSKLKHT
jgi:CDP-diglyceride synthetase